jgi:hypothetical protein
LKDHANFSIWFLCAWQEKRIKNYYQQQEKKRKKEKRKNTMEESSRQLEMWAQNEGDKECFARALNTLVCLPQE